MRGILLALAGTLLFAGPAYARHPHRHAHHRPAVVVAPPPAVHVVVDPWGPAYVPAPRAGYVWVPGYVHHGRYVPGHWQPTYSRAGYVWVQGHWAGRHYVEGYWRPVAQRGMVWVEGGYDERGVWHEGYWAAAGPPPRSAPPEASSDDRDARDAYDERDRDVREEGEVHHDYE